MAALLNQQVELSDAAANMAALSCLVEELPLSDAVMATLRRHSAVLCRTLRRFQFADAAAAARKHSAHVIIAMLLAATRCQTDSQRRHVFAAALPYTAAVTRWAAVREADSIQLRQTQLGSVELLRVAADVATPRHAWPEDVVRAALPPEEVLAAALLAASAHAEAAMDYAVQARRDGLVEAEKWRSLRIGAVLVIDCCCSAS